MRLKLIFCVVAVALQALLATHATAQTPLVFDLRDPAEAARWRFGGPAASDPASTRTPDGLQVAAPPGPNGWIERDVTLNTALYNRLVVRMRGRAREDQTGFLTAAFFWSVGTPGDVLAETRLTKFYPNEATSLVVFPLTQSLLWSGTIPMIRLDPVWGEGTALVESLTFDYEPPPPPAPTYDFTRAATLPGWSFGEFNPQFVARPTRQDADGITWDYPSPSPVFQSFDLAIAAATSSAVELEMRQHIPHPTAVRLFWAREFGSNFKPEIAGLVAPLRPTTDWQTVRIELRGHPEWNGTILGLMINPGLAGGATSIRRIRFVPIEGLGTRGQSDAALRWMTQEEVSRELREGRYKPLMVLISKDGNDFARRAEQELAASAPFLERASAFHAVRFDISDPVVERRFGTLYRVPVLVFMAYDFSTRTWTEQARLVGPEVTRDAVEQLGRWAPRN